MTQRQYILSTASYNLNLSVTCKLKIAKHAKNNLSYTNSFLFFNFIWTEIGDSVFKPKGQLCKYVHGNNT